LGAREETLPTDAVLAEVELAEVAERVQPLDAADVIPRQDQHLEQA
jgi:hypothetical protein